MSDRPLPYRRPSDGWARFAVGAVAFGLSIVCVLYVVVRLLVNHVLGEPLLPP